MGTNRILESIAKTAMKADHDGLSAIEKVDALLSEFLETEPCRNHEGLKERAQGAHETVKRIADTGVDSLSDALDELYGTIDALLAYSEAVDLGSEPPPSAEVTDGAGDSHLLEAWIDTSIDALADLEAVILRLDSDAEPQDTDAARRIIHTIKGECGVIPAHGIQSLFHEAESAIERQIESGGAFPVSLLLELIDWMRSMLREREPAELPSTQADPALLARLREAGTDGGATQLDTGAPDVAEDASADTSSGSVPETTEPSSNEATETSATADAGGLVVIEAEMDEMLQEFIAESREHFVNSEQALLALESSPEDKELVNTVFRAFHTIKGVASFLNLDPIVTLAHKAEFLLDAARNGSVAITASFLDLSLGACDLLSSMITSLEGGPAPTQASFDETIRLLDRALAGDVQAAATPLEATSPSEPTPAGADVSTQPLPGTEPKPAPAPAGSGGARANKRHVDQTIKVNTIRLDSLVDMVGELVIGHQMVVQDPEVSGLTEQRTQRNLVHVGKIIRDLQEVAMSLRMVTLQGPFQKMARLVRDLSSKSGKRIALRIEGEDTELDRNVVDEIGDPLVHMIRNACDHGIESPEERTAAGKSPEGTLALRAFHKGGSIVIEVEDDGRGLHRTKIIEKAQERGILPTDRDPKELSDNEVYQLLFAPGFSTAETITDVSGRGVGMDVVKRNIEALRGKIEIRSRPGLGSTFVLSLPLTMAIIDGMVVRVGAQRYVIPTLSIEQSFRPNTEEITTVMGRGEAVMVRGSLLPIYRLNELFGLAEGSHDLSETLLVVVESNTSRGCIQVDELLGQQQVVIKSLGQGLGHVRGVSGGAILGDGLVAPILDVAGLFAQAAEHGAGSTAAHPQGALR